MHVTIRAVNKAREERRPPCSWAHERAKRARLTTFRCVHHPVQRRVCRHRHVYSSKSLNVL